MTYDKDRDEVKKMKAKYLLNRNELMKKIKAHRSLLEKVALEGATTDDELRIARTACCILASDLHYEASVMDDKQGLTNPKDDMDEFLENLSKGKNGLTEYGDEFDDDVSLN